MFQTLCTSPHTSPTSRNSHNTVWTPKVGITTKNSTYISTVSYYYYYYYYYKCADFSVEALHKHITQYSALNTSEMVMTNTTMISGKGITLCTISPCHRNYITSYQNTEKNN